MTIEQAPRSIPVPANFPVKWESPEEAARFWTPDLMHWPHGISNLSATMDMPAFGRGLAKVADELCMPFRNMTFRHVNGYVFNSTDPWSDDPEEIEKRINEMRGRMMQHIPGLLDRWRKEYEPEVRSINEDTLLGDYSKLGDKDIAELLEKIVAKREREGELHFLAVFPAMGAVMAFEEVYTNLIGAPQNEEHLMLLQGFPNKSTEANDGLWDLAQEAQKRPQVMEVLSRVPAAQVHEALGASDQGRAFRDAVEEYNSKYGWRANELDIAEPTWKEEPTPVYTLIKDFTAREDYDPREEYKSLVRTREEKEKMLLDKLAGGPVETFRQFLGAAQQYLPIQEDHNFWIDQQGVCVQRVPVLEAGRRLVSGGRIAAPGDVFHLYYDELQGALRGERGDLHELVEQRRREREHFKQIAPPEAIGTMPPLIDENPMAVKFWGGRPEKNPDPKVINGNAASAGRTTGTARVILSLEEADRLSPGEILVCPATMPPWTPLFGVASAVVTDHGGILSHTAIVAREYQIPAVVGTKVGTTQIPDGATITVDGTAGTVKIEG